MPNLLQLFTELGRVHLLGTCEFTYLAQMLYVLPWMTWSPCTVPQLQHGQEYRWSFLKDSTLMMNAHTKELSTSESEGYENGKCVSALHSFKKKIRVWTLWHSNRLWVMGLLLSVPPYTSVHWWHVRPYDERKMDTHWNVFGNNLESEWYMVAICYKMKSIRALTSKRNLQRGMTGCE